MSNYSSSDNSNLVTGESSPFSEINESKRYSTSSSTTTSSDYTTSASTSGIIIHATIFYFDFYCNS